MICKKCNEKQFFTKRIKHKPVAWVCAKCKEEIEIKEPKKTEIKDGK